VKCARATLSSLASPALTYFSTLSHKRNDFRKESFIEHKYVFLFSIQLFMKRLILRRTERDVIKDVCWFLCKVSVIRYSSQILMKLEFSGQILERYISNFMKIRQWEPCCSLAKGRKDGLTEGPDEATSRFSQSCEPP
jgi:hypothetical protein